jgi:hypothetical protein
MKGVIRNGRVELDQPINLPDGTELLISVANGKTEDDEEGWDTSPEGIANWLKWYDTLLPLKITPEEQADADAWLKRMSEYENAKRDTESRGLFQ